MAGSPLINNRTQRSRSVGGMKEREDERRAEEKERETGNENEMENRGRGKIKRDTRTRVVLSAISVSLSFNWQGVGQSRGWKRGGLERGMDFMPRARYMAAATPGQK